MNESHEITSLEQLRAMADMLRLQIIDLLKERAMTVTQVAGLLNIAPAKMHYHVHELERVGLLRLVKTQEKGGVLEKYYEAIARELSVSKALLLSVPPDESLAAISFWFDQLKDDFQRAFRSALEKKDDQLSLMLGHSHLYLTAQEQKELAKQIAELLKPYEQKRNIEGEKRTATILICYPPEVPPRLDTSGDAIIMDETCMVGVAHFSRADLLKALSEGKRLRIKVVGVCQFADDITSELADRAVEQFSLIGKLHAPSPIKAILQKKQ